MYVIGVDQSLNHTGLCAHSPAGKITFKLIEPKKMTGPSRLAYIRDALKEFLAAQRYTVGLLEGYAIRSIGRKFELGEVGAVVKLALYDACDAVYVAAPKQLKKYVTANGSADKAQVMAAIREQWGLNIQNDNLADAYGLSHIALQIAHTTTTKRHQLDVLNDILKTRIYIEKPKLKFSKAFKGAI
jgi:Holliday junction resolvasome RuvABC endonuclease subunit